MSQSVRCYDSDKQELLSSDNFLSKLNAHDSAPSLDFLTSWGFTSVRKILNFSINLHRSISYQDISAVWNDFLDFCYCFFFLICPWNATAFLQPSCHRCFFSVINSVASQPLKWRVFAYSCWRHTPIKSGGCVSLKGNLEILVILLLWWYHRFQQFYA